MCSTQFDESAALVFEKSQQLRVMESKRLGDNDRWAVPQPDANYFRRMSKPSADGKVISVFGDYHQTVGSGVFPNRIIARFFQAD